MATDAVEILPLAQAKVQLYIEPDRTDLDGRVTSAIKAAVAHVQNASGLPLLDVTEPYDVAPSGKTRPVLIPAQHIVDVTELKFWQPAQKLREEPMGTVDVTSLGRRFGDSSPLLRGTWLWPPEDGWPSRLAGSCLRVTVLRRFEIPKHEEDIRHDIIVWMRHYYEQPEKIESDFAVLALDAAVRARHSGHV